MQLILSPDRAICKADLRSILDTDQRFIAIDQAEGDPAAKSGQQLAAQHHILRCDTRFKRNNKAGTATYRIRSIPAAEQHHRPRRCRKRIVACAPIQDADARQRIVTGTARQIVVARHVGYRVVTTIAIQHIVARIAVQSIPSGTRMHHIATVSCADTLRPDTAVQHIAACRTRHRLQHIVAKLAPQYHLPVSRFNPFDRAGKITSVYMDSARPVIDTEHAQVITVTCANDNVFNRKPRTQNNPVAPAGILDLVITIPGIDQIRIITRTAIQVVCPVVVIGIIADHIPVGFLLGIAH